MAEQEKDFSSVQFGSKENKESELSQRDQMIAILRSGQTTMHKGKHIKSVADVPSEAELAAGNPTLAADASERLKKQIAEAEAQLKQIAESKPEPKKPEFKPIEKEASGEKAESKGSAKK